MFPSFDYVLAVHSQSCFTIKQERITINKERISDLEDKPVENIYIKVHGGGEGYINKENFIRNRLDGVEVWACLFEAQEEVREKMRTQAIFEEMLVKNFPKESL